MYPQAARDASLMLRKEVETIERLWSHLKKDGNGNHVVDDNAQVLSIEREEGLRLAFGDPKTKKKMGRVNEGTRKDMIK